MSDTPKTDTCPTCGYPHHDMTLTRDRSAAQARIAELETTCKGVAHCGTCGDTWYDSGIASATCPYCRIAELERERDVLRAALKKVNDQAEHF